MCVYVYACVPAHLCFTSVRACVRMCVVRVCVYVCEGDRYREREGGGR